MTRPILLRLGIPLALLVAALLVLRSQLRHLDVGEVFSNIRALPAWRVTLAACVTIVNYLQLTMYDVLGLAYVKRKLQYTRVAPASLLAIAFGHNIGPSLLSGGSIRYRFYTEQGLSPSEIARLVGFISITFALGYAWIAGAMLSSVPQTTKLPIPTSATRLLGILLLFLGGSYVALSAVGLRRIPFGRSSLDYPRLGLAVSQVCVAVIDWLSMAMVLSLLLPVDLSSYWDILRMLLVAQIAGMLSQVPGGLGVFESLMVAALGATLPVAVVLGSLVVYRLVYNLLPFAIAMLGLAVYELLSHFRARQQATRQTQAGSR